MYRFKLRMPVGETHNVDPDDAANTKAALNRHGYYATPSGGEFGGWVDSAMFDGIRKFQKNNNLKVDGFMRPGGPTERALADGEEETTICEDCPPLNTNFGWRYINPSTAVAPNGKIHLCKKVFDEYGDFVECRWEEQGNSLV